MVLARLALLLALVLGGHLARRVGVLDPGRTARLNAFAFFVALPALVFVSTYDRRPAELASPALLGGLWVTYATVVALALVVHRWETRPDRQSVAIVQSYHSNFGYIGLPIVTAALGAAAAGRASVILGVGSLTQTPLTILLLVRMNGTDVAVGRQLRRLATNPILVSLVVGLVVATQRLSPPAPLLRGLEWLSLTALPVALLAVGASLDRTGHGDGLERIVGVVGVKLLAMPVVAFLAFTALGAAPIAVAAGVVMFGTPTAVASYIYASELGGNAEQASTTVFVTTVVGLVTLSVLVVLFG
jgi:predicted permease